MNVMLAVTALLVSAAEIAYAVRAWRDCSPMARTYLWIFTAAFLLSHNITPILTPEAARSPEDYATLILYGGMGFGVFIAVASRMLRRPPGADATVPDRLAPPSRLLDLAALALCALHLTQSVQNGLFYKRMGSEYVARMMGEMSTLDLALFRAFDVLTIPMWLGLRLWWVRSRRRSSIMHWVPGAYILIHAFVNSRLHFVLLVAFVLWITVSRDFSIRRALRYGAIFGPILVVAMLFIGAARPFLFLIIVDPQAGLSAAVESMTESEKVDGFSDQGQWRTDGFFAAARVRASDLPFMGLDDIERPFVFLFPWLPEVQELKASGLTASKNLIDARYHITNGQLDFPTSVLLEGYARAGLFGILLTCAALGLCAASYLRQLEGFSGRTMDFVAMLAVTIFSVVEYGVLENVVRIIQALPFMLLLEFLLQAARLLSRSRNVSPGQDQGGIRRPALIPTCDEDASIR